MRLRDALTDAGISAEEAADPAGLGGAIRKLPAPSPWINRLVAGIGAWLSSCFFCGSFGLCFGRVLDLDEGFGVLIGAAMIAVGTIVHRLFHEGVAGLFLRQVALSWALAGQAILYVTLADATSTEVAAVAMMGLAPILIVAFADPIQRFISAATAIAGFLWLLRELDLPVAIPSSLATVAMILLAWLPAERGLNASLSAMRMPLIWAGYLGLCCINAFYLRDGWLFDSPGVAKGAGGVPWWIALTAALGLSAVALERQRALRSEVGATLLAAIVGVAALTQGRAGVLLGLIGVLLGWDRRDRALTAAGICYFVFFGAQYYYDLSFDLWTKGAALIGSGALLIGLRAWLRFRNLLGETT